MWCLKSSGYLVRIKKPKSQIECQSQGRKVPGKNARATLQDLPVPNSVLSQGGIFLQDANMAPHLAMREPTGNLRVLFLTLEFRHGTFSGNGVLAQSQAHGLAKAGHAVLVVSGCPDDLVVTNDATAKMQRA